MVFNIFQMSFSSTDMLNVFSRILATLEARSLLPRP